MNFSSIAGHGQNIDRIKETIKSSRIPHGIIFTGPEGIGKRLVAVSLVAALNCEDSKKKGACGICGSCMKLKTGNHPMIRFVGSPKNEEELVVKFGNGDELTIKNVAGVRYSPGQPGSSSGSKTVKININQIRQVIREASLKPYKNSSKIFIIDDAADASIGALNCLLKILEEPPQNTYFFLITSGRDLLPATIISRCREYRFAPLTDREMKNFLKLREDLKNNIKDVGREIKIAGGSPGKFVEYAQMDDIKLGDVKTESYFKEIKKWMGDKSESLRKLNIMLHLEGYD
ncbi:MAG: hypothetical protein PF545_02575, partial [Elusimicrobia bacterium]|nr:hypothetical protein [Elusimicrobiota bacterium]